MVGAGYTEREDFDGQGFSSPGRWSQEDRLYPSSSLWLQIQRMIFHTAETMTSSWHGFVRGTQVRRDLPFDFRMFLILLSAAGYPEVKICEFAFGVRFGPGTKLPRCTHHRSLHRQSRQWITSSIVSWRMTLAFCRRFRSSFLPVLSVSSDLSSQHLISLLVYHFLIIILAVAVFGVEQFVIIFCLHRFHDLVVLVQFRALLDRDVGFSEGIYAIVFFCE